MIGFFDSGYGGLTIFHSIERRLPAASLIYLGDHGNAPYGNRSSDEIVDLTRQGVETLFDRGARLVILACNTATAVACRTLQQEWLPDSRWTQHNVLGIIAPTVEAATQTPWAITEPQYPQKFNAESIAIFATRKTTESAVYPEEIRKRCPQVQVIQKSCPDLAGEIENGASEQDLSELVRGYIDELLSSAEPAIPDNVILGCTHYHLIKDLFAKYLPARTRILSQPRIVADSLEHYLLHHREYLGEPTDQQGAQAYTSGDADRVNAQLSLFSDSRIVFQGLTRQQVC